MNVCECGVLTGSDCNNIGGSLRAALCRFPIPGVIVLPTTGHGHAPQFSITNLQSTGELQIVHWPLKIVNWEHVAFSADIKVHGKWPGEVFACIGAHEPSVVRRKYYNIKVDSLASTDLGCRP